MSGCHKEADFHGGSSSIPLMDTDTSYNDVIVLGAIFPINGVSFVYFGRDLNVTTTDIHTLMCLR